MAGVQVAFDRCVKPEAGVGEFFQNVTDRNGIEFPAAHEKFRVSFVRWRKELIKIRHRTVVEERRRRPDSGQRTGFVSEPDFRQIEDAEAVPLVLLLLGDFVVFVIFLSHQPAREEQSLDPSRER